MTEATTNEAATEAKAELTIAEKIAQLRARIAKLEQQELTESLLNNIAVGDDVTIKFGRADKAREIEGKVVGVALPNIVVLTEALETFKVHVRDVIANPTAAARNDENEPVVNVEEINPVDGRRPDEAGADPLEAA